MNTDPLADMLTRIRNAYVRQHEKVVVPASQFKENVLKILKEEGYIKDYKVVSVDKTRSGLITVYLKYDSEGKSIISNMKRVSKPGCRVYHGVKEFKKVLDGLGTAIISTPKGVMSDKECRKLKLGGEVLCYIW